MMVVPRVVFGIIIGAVCGYAVYRFIGCSTGTCPITGNPFIATIYGALLGLMLTAGGK